MPWVGTVPSSDSVASLMPGSATFPPQPSACSGVVAKNVLDKIPVCCLGWVRTAHRLKLLLYFLEFLAVSWDTHTWL